MSQDNWTGDAIKTLFKKVDQITSDQGDMKVTLARLTDSVEYHIKRSDSLEAAVDLLKQKVESTEDELISHDKSNTERSSELKNHLEDQIVKSTQKIMEVVKPMCEDYREQIIMRKLRAERNKKLKFWVSMIGAIGTTITIIMNASKLWALLIALL